MRVYAVASNEGYPRITRGPDPCWLLKPMPKWCRCNAAVRAKHLGCSANAPPGGEQWRAQRTIGAHDLVRRDPYLPSRVVENLFWFGRYCERCDDSAR